MNILEKEFVEMYCDLADMYGMDPSFIKIFSVIYIQPEELAMEDLAEKTGYSLASISNKAAILARLGMIKKVRKPKSKKIFLYADKNFANIMKNYLLKKDEIGIQLVKERVPILLKEYKGKTLSDREKKQINIIENYYRQIIKLESVIHKAIEEIDKFSKNEK